MAIETLVTKKMLVGTEGRPEDEEALTLLCGTVGTDRVRLKLVHVLTVPMTAPLDVAMPEAERNAEHLLARSRAIAERFQIHVETAVLRGRDVGSALVDEARRTGADALVVRFRSRPSALGHYLVSATVSTLLRSAPCPVITFHHPHR